VLWCLLFDLLTWRAASGPADSFPSKIGNGLLLLVGYLLSSFLQALPWLFFLFRCVRDSAETFLPFLLGGQAFCFFLAPLGGPHPRAYSPSPFLSFPLSGTLLTSPSLLYKFQRRKADSIFSKEVRRKWSFFFAIVTRRTDLFFLFPGSLFLIFLPSRLNKDGSVLTFPLLAHADSRVCNSFSPFPSSGTQLKVSFVNQARNA